MKSLVVGGNGFIGSNLVDRLVECGHEVVVLDLWQRRYDKMPPEVRFMQGQIKQSFLLFEALADVNVVYHLAWAMTHEMSNRDLVADVRANLVSSLHLIEASLRAGVDRIVFVSSGGTVYGHSGVFDIPENAPKTPLSSYGITKLAVEKYIQMFNHLYGLDYVILRPSVPYGPRQSPHGRQGAVAVFLYRVAHGLPLTIWGDGSVTRDYFYISDLIDALVTSMDRELSKHRIFNISGDEKITLVNLVELVEQTVGRKAIVEYSPARKFDATRIILDTQLARHELDWQPKVPMVQGLAMTWNWMKTHEQ
ncbi:hypothetical protein LCGC14_1643860 [marine sediment metagenome]|uniref:NAD-dependent epimerase/dehydratase domain-containing protein n=1 Tax=marine sediment metagenome TaxID=412755 RepID=A0A0F9HZL1_9ZZZZ